MKVVIAGGTGQVGRLLSSALAGEGHEVVVLSRRPPSTPTNIRHCQWDAQTLGPWVSELEGADALINLAGRSVSCRYTEANLQQMMDSRVESTRVLGKAMEGVALPPSAWLQMSTATIYADTRDGSNDEFTGRIGGDEPNVPPYWEYSVRIAKQWEAAQLETDLQQTRRVALRAAMVMTPSQGGVFDALLLLARLGLGGPVAGGAQRVSWIHGDDFVRAVLFLLERDDISGPVNLSSPDPVSQAQLMEVLRQIWGRRLGLPATSRMASIGAWALRTDPELLLKSRSVIPGRLCKAGFVFEYPTWLAATEDLVARVRSRPEGTALAPSLRTVIDLSRSN